MKIFISTDMEGTSGVIHREQFMHGNGNYERFRKLMTQEINAAIEGAIEAGADEIVVNDSHGSMRNVLIEELHSEARLITGFPKRLLMMEGIDSSFDGVIFTGYHSMANSEGVFSHTIFGSVFDSIKLNGVEYGEAGLNAAIAGHLGVPVIMASGDSCLEAEVKKLLPKVEFARVKDVHSYMAANCLSPKKAQELIKNKAAKAVSGIAAHEPFVICNDINVEFALKGVQVADIASAIPSIERVSPLNVKYRAKDIMEVVGITTTIMYASCVLLIDIYK